MYITIIGLGVLTLVLTALMGFRYKSNMSRFELKRRAEHSKEYKDQLKFQQIYPGIRVLISVLELVVAVAICSLAYAQWQFVGALISLGAIVLALLLSRSLRRMFSELIDRHLAWFNKYFGWAEILGRIHLGGDEPQIQSRQELAHIIEKASFIDEAEKKLIASSVELSDKKVSDIMVKRNEIVSVSRQDSMGPKLIDELHSSGHQIFPVIGENLDDIVGTMYLDDVTIIDRANRTLADVMRPSLPSVDKGQSLVDALGLMAKQHVTVMIVTGDKGKTAGLITLQDIASTILNK